MGGDPAAPPVEDSTNNMLQAFVQNYPDLLRVTDAGAVPAAQSQLAATQATAPAIAALNAQLYNTYGTQLGATSDAIATQQAQDAAKSNLDVINGAGGQSALAADALQRQIDPEYYKSRADISSSLGNLLGSVDLSGNLSGGENEAIARSLAQDNNNRGIAPNTPSQTATVNDALTYGNAAYNRKQAAQNTLTQALNAGSSFLPAAKSIDAFQTATGNPSGNATNAAANAQFTGTSASNGAANAATSLGSNLLGQIGTLTSQQNDIDANRRDSLDRFNQSFSSVVGSL